MRKRLLFLTGGPGTGKTTVLLKIVEALRSKGYRVGGMLSREVRSCGARVGFEILDLSSSKHGWLAHVDQKSGPQVGRYRVNVRDLEDVGATAIVEAAETSDAVVVDEIGPMELYSEKFKEAVKRAVESQRLVVGVVHWKSEDRLVDELKTREDTQVHVVTAENRDNMHRVVLEEAIAFLSNLRSTNEVL